jgi:exodeoxyribonuclease VII large subunit
MNMNDRFVATVSQVSRRIALTFKKDTELTDLHVRGEVSNYLRHYKSGHIYFTLKDADSALKCVMFSLEAESLTFEPENGQSIIARGNIGIYERDGVYQLYVSAIESEEQEKPEENIFAQFLKLKEKLEKERIFENNRVLPAYPKKICVITSRDGAALQDMLSVFERRYPLLEVVLIPALVQGQNAPKSLTDALDAAQGIGADLIILARGGGSAEDLWAFNDEALARVICASAVPVVSAVGHETDFTIADFAADLRAPTPSAAAELTTPDIADLSRALDAHLAALRRRVVSIVERKQQRLDAVVKLIDALNPERVFARGFAAVFGEGGELIRNAESVNINDELEIKLAQGGLTVVVKGVKNEKRI